MELHELHELLHACRMASEAASLLDQLMGTHRNAVPEDNVKPLTYSSEEVCKFFLCGFCPSELFTNTKADIGGFKFQQYVRYGACVIPI